MKALSAAEPGTLQSFPRDFSPSHYNFNDLITFKISLNKNCTSHPQAVCS